MSRLGSISDVKECLITTKRISTFDRVNTQLKLDSCWNMVYMNDDNFAMEVKKDDIDQIMVELTLPFSKIPRSVGMKSGKEKFFQIQKSMMNSI